MPEIPIVAKPQPCGSRLIRLADIPKHLRMRAARSAVCEAKDEREAQRLLAIALDPGDAGGRIAA